VGFGLDLTVGTVGGFTKESVMMRLLKRLLHEDSGQDLIEYGLLVGVITIGAITAITTLGPRVASYFSTLNTRLPTP
jgi:pilus assembly protein Flp/PilA